MPALHLADDEMSLDDHRQLVTLLCPDFPQDVYDSVEPYLPCGEDRKLPYAVISAYFQVSRFCLLGRAPKGFVIWYDHSKVATCNLKMCHPMQFQVSQFFWDCHGISARMDSTTIARHVVRQGSFVFKKGAPSVPIYAGFLIS